MPPLRPNPCRRAFTLLEIVLVMVLITMLLAVGIPSMRGQLARQKLQSAFERFDTLAVEAQKRSVTDGEPYVLVWQKGGAIRLYPVAWNADQRRHRDAAAAWLPGNSDERYTLVHTAALAEHPAAEWTFWPSGNCEPAAIKYAGDGGTWEAVYNPLSARGTFKSFLAR